MMNKFYPLIALVLMTAELSAQTKTGINNLNPTVTLDVTGAPATATMLDGIMAPKITGNQLRAKTYTATQNGTIIYVTAADSAPGGQTVNVTMPGYYYFNGPTLTWVWFVVGVGKGATTGQVLTANASGMATWQTLAITSIPGNLPTISVNFTTYGSGTPPNTTLYTSGSIALPPGKWLVAFGSTAGIGYNSGYPRMLDTDSSLWLTLYLSDDNTTGGNTVDYIPGYSGPRGSAGVLGRGANKTFVSGYEAINNTSGATKTYYLWAYQEQDIINASGKTQFDNGAGTQVNAYWINVMDKSYWERYFFAIPIQ